jgi:hypothetical protein
MANRFGKQLVFNDFPVIEYCVPLIALIADDSFTVYDGEDEVAVITSESYLDLILGYVPEGSLILAGSVNRLNF